MKAIISIGTIIGLVTLMGLAAPARMDAQSGSDPASVFQAFYMATNAHNIDIAVALFAPDAVVTVVGPGGGIFAGQDAIRAWLQQSNGQNFHVDPEPPQVTGDVLVDLAKVTLDPWKALGVAPLDSAAQMVVQSGKITSLVFSLTPSGSAKLGAAYAQLPPGDPVSVVEAMKGMLAASNVDGALAMFADNAVVTTAPPSPNSTGVWSGKQAIRDFLAASHIEPHFTLQTGPNMAISLDSVTIDLWKQLGIAPLDSVSDVVVENGKIKTFVTTLTPMAAAKLGAALAKGS